MTKTTKSRTKNKPASKTAKTTQKKSLVAENSQITIVLKAKNIKPVYQKHLKKIAKNIKMDGFRKGMTPLALAEQKIGQEKLINKVLNELLPNAYQQAITEAKKKPLSRPSFQISKIVMDADWEIIAHFAQEPKFELGSYKKVVKAAKKEAEGEIKKLQQDDKKNNGAKKTKTKQNKIPAMSDTQKKDAVLQKIFQVLITSIKPAIPSLLIEEQTQQDLKQLGQSLSKMNLKLEDYLKAQNMQMNQLSNRLAMSALGKLQIDFILHKIAAEVKITAEQKDLDEKIKNLKNPDLEKKIKQDKYYQNYLKSIIVRQKTLDFLYNM